MANYAALQFIPFHSIEISQNETTLANVSVYTNHHQLKFKRD